MSKGFKIGFAVGATVLTLASFVVAVGIVTFATLNRLESSAPTDDDLLW